MVFLHGLCGSQDNFFHLQKYFPNSRAFDIVGFGREAKPNLAYDKECFLQFLKEKISSPTVLVGHSMGAILAKEFAIKYPDLVRKVYAIGYPLQKSPKDLEAVIRRDYFLAMYLDENPLAKMVCHSKALYKYFLVPLGLIFYPRRFLSFWHYFSHTYNSASRAIKNTILRDDGYSTEIMKSKMVFISGEKDASVNTSLLENYRHTVISGMGHVFFGFEKEIAGAIKYYEQVSE